MKSSNEAPCSFCGERRANAVWHGALSEIRICSECAKHTLPKFMADAVFAEFYPGAVNKKERAMDQFWKATLLLHHEFTYAAFLIALDM
jgi:hypothetical protein